MDFIAHSFIYYCVELVHWLLDGCSLNGEPVDIDPECVSHDEYLTEFKSMLITKLRNAIDADLSNDPDCIKGRKKTVQVSDFKCILLYPIPSTMVTALPGPNTACCVCAPVVIYKHVTLSFKTCQIFFNSSSQTLENRLAVVYLFYRNSLIGCSENMQIYSLSPGETRI